MYKYPTPCFTDGMSRIARVGVLHDAGCWVVRVQLCCVLVVTMKMRLLVGRGQRTVMGKGGAVGNSLKCSNFYILRISVVCPKAVQIHERPFRAAKELKTNRPH